MSVPVNSGSGVSATGTALTVTMGGTATAGNLLIASVNSDATITTPAGWALDQSSVGSQGLYIFSKISVGGETNVALNPTVSAPASGWMGEYAPPTGRAWTAPVKDVSSSATRSGAASASQASGTTAVISGVTAMAFAAVGPHSISSGTWTAPTWTNSYVNRTTAGQTGTVGTASGLWVSDLDIANGVTTAQTTTCTWTTSSFDAGGAIVVYKSSVGAGVTSAPRVVMAPYIGAY